jgi:hypothetical protein
MIPLELEMGSSIADRYIVQKAYECLAYYEDHQRELDPLIAAQMAPPDE